jgi:pimeloyl-ACP methyl ester carboxylesterase
VGTSGREVLAAQNYLVQKKMGSTEEVAVWSKEAINGVCLIIAKNTAKDAIEPLNNYIDAKYETAPAEYKASTPLSQYKMGVVMLLNNDWGRQFIRFETANYLKKITVPVLAINGSQDIQVPAVESQAGFAQHFSKRSKANSKAIVVDGLNHLFQQCETCSIMEYGELEETFSEIVLKEMTTWIKGLK